MLYVLSRNDNKEVCGKEFDLICHNSSEMEDKEVTSTGISMYENVLIIIIVIL